jgi:hypothetical protein
MRMYLNRDYCSQLGAAPGRRRRSFDAKWFLACIGAGRSIGKYRKRQVVFSQGVLPKRSETISRLSAVPRMPGAAVFLTRLATTTPLLIVEHVAQMRAMSAR